MLCVAVFLVLFVVRCNALSAVCTLLVAACGSLFDAYRSLIHVCCLLVVLIVASCSWLAVCCLLFVVCCSLALCLVCCVLIGVRCSL